MPLKVRILNPNHKATVSSIVPTLTSVQEGAVSFVAYGVGIRIVSNDPTILRRLLGLLPPGSEIDEAASIQQTFSVRNNCDQTYTLYSGARCIDETSNLGSLLAVLENFVHIVVGYWAKREFLFVHAGVVGWNNRAIVIPGRSRSGKTTLVTELIKAGATYFSDDMAVLDSEGRVHPFSVPLSHREKVGTKRYTPEQFGARTAQAPLPIGLVLVTQFDEMAHWRPRPLSPSQIVLALLDNTVSARRAPESSLPILRKAAENAVGIDSERADAAKLVNTLLTTTLKSWSNQL